MNLLILPKHELRGALDGCIGGAGRKVLCGSKGLCVVLQGRDGGLWQTPCSLFYSFQQFAARCVMKEGFHEY